ncbi:Hypothetical predicted protein [Cloeon dipterum]|uniref:Uncharacterized protein n=1 Tax=Cloeon dipterum TaxID=197152 RepID=A0A8S1CW62_9INSE|nr:Hypothetical predicted protein [Cloeon dipterum]
MGQKQSQNKLSVLDVSNPRQVQHKAQLKLDPDQGIVLQVPELENYLEEEGIPFSDRATWDVLRYIYQVGGMRMVRNTLPMVKARKRVRLEPAPDYDLSTSDAASGSVTTESTPSAQRRRQWSSREEPEQFLRKVASQQQARTSVRKLPEHSAADAMSEGGDDWRSARSSTQEITIQWVAADEPSAEFVRPASKVWKRPMSPEVHADLVKALKKRESHETRTEKEFEEIEIKRTHTILITDPDMNG